VITIRLEHELMPFVERGKMRAGAGRRESGDKFFQAVFPAKAGIHD
jgi:hypothetical protein